MTSALAPAAEPEVLDPLPTVEQDRLAELEAVIERGLDAFVATGEALLAIKREKLYRETDQTFAAYLRRRWNLSPSRAEQIRASARVHQAIVEHTGKAPEASADALRMLAPVVRARGGKAAAETFEKVRQEHGEKPSAAKVRQAVAHAGVVPYAGQSNRRTSLSSIGSGLTTARTRLDRLRGELDGAPLGAQARKSARGLADTARALAVELDDLGGVVAAAPEPEPEEVRCECASPMPDGTGGCVKCGRTMPWQPRAARMATAELAATA